MKPLKKTAFALAIVAAFSTLPAQAETQPNTAQAETRPKALAYTWQVIGGTEGSKTLIKFGTEVLAQTAEGRAYIQKFHELSPDVVWAMMQDEDLRELTRRETYDIAKLIAQGRRQGAIASEVVDRVEALLQAFAHSPAASEKLRNGIAEINTTMPIRPFAARVNTLLVSRSALKPKPVVETELRDRLMVRFKAGVAQAHSLSILSAYGVSVQAYHPELNLYTIKLPSVTSAQTALQVLSASDSVEYVEPVYPLTINKSPNDPDVSKLWGLHNTGQTRGKPDADIGAPRKLGISP